MLVLVFILTEDYEGWWFRAAYNFMGTMVPKHSAANRTEQIFILTEDYGCSFFNPTVRWAPPVPRFRNQLTGASGRRKGQCSSA